MNGKRAQPLILGEGGVVDGRSFTVATSGRLWANPQTAVNKTTRTAREEKTRRVT
jgi:hypothetical protein